MDDSTTKTTTSTSSSRRLTKKPPPSRTASSSTASATVSATATTTTTTATYAASTSTSTTSSSSSSPYLASDRFDHHQQHQQFHHHSSHVQHPQHHPHAHQPHHPHHHQHNRSVQHHAHPHQLHSQRSSASLQRSPSAPTFPRYHTPPAHGRSRTGSINPNSSNSSLDRAGDRDRDRDRDLPSAGASGPLPILAGPESVAPSGPGGGKRLSNPTRPFQEKGPDDFIGAPFDGSEILNSLELTKVPGYHSSVRKAPPPPLAQPGPDPTMADIPLQHSASSSSGERTSERSTPRVGENQLISPKRYSDEGKDVRQGMIRKKSGFSGFMNSIGVGSPRGVKISAPENPVHVTHVGYDNQTGQFTVRPLLLSMDMFNPAAC